MSSLQLNMFGPPEDLSNLSAEAQRRDDAPIAGERELLWPSDLSDLLGPELLDRLYGDIPRHTRLTMREVCRRMRWQHTHVYDMVHAGSLDATDGSHPSANQPYYGIYRYSLVKLLFHREFVQDQTRACLSDADLDSCMAAADELRRRRNQRRRA